MFHSLTALIETPEHACVTAHRGACAIQPENTLPAMRAAVAAGAVATGMTRPAPASARTATRAGRFSRARNARRGDRELRTGKPP